MFYCHWLKKKLLWPMAGQNIARWEIKQRYGEKEGGVRKMTAAAREARCELTSHEPHGKLENRNGLIYIVRAS